MPSSNVLVVKFNLQNLSDLAMLIQKLKDDFSDNEMSFSLPRMHANLSSLLPSVNTNVLYEIKRALGSWSEIARICGVSGACVSYWRDNFRIPYEHIKKVVDAANRKKGGDYFKYRDLCREWLD